MSDLSWYIDCKNSKLLTSKLNGFFTKQQEVSRALQEAKLLGICRTTISEVKKLDLQNLGGIKKNGQIITKTDTTRTKKDSRETS